MRKPATIKAGIVGEADRLRITGDVYFPNHGRILASRLDKILGDKTKRYELCKWLSGQASTKTMDGHVILATLDWLGGRRFESEPSREAEREVQACLTEAIEASGIMNMFKMQKAKQPKNTKEKSIMNMQFTKATKTQAKLRLAIFGPSGSGKTFSALRIATGMEGTIAFIDTERGSASKYADRFSFDVLELPQSDISTYVNAIEAANQADYAILVIDSLTHAWQELLQEVDRLAKAKYRGNTWAAWSDGTPKQRQLVNAILNYNGHIIATMRTKTEWMTESTGGGKSKPVRVGLAPQQGKGIEYEFDLLMEINPDHIANVIKDRTGKFQDQLIDKPSEKLGKQLSEWLMDGEIVQPKTQKRPVSPPETAPPAEHIRQWDNLILDAIVAAGHAKHEINARAMLNLSVLPENVGDVTATSWAKYYRASRDSGEDTEAAAGIANKRYTKAMEKK